MKDKLEMFNSLPEFVDAWLKCDVRDWFEASSSAWRGGDKADVYRFASSGDLDAVEAAERIVGRIDANVSLEDLRDNWQTSVCGVIPVVPAYLAGAPESMLAMVPALSDKSEIEIWVSPTVSGGVSVEDLKRRGRCLLAFIMAVQRVRPVRLVVFCESEARAACIRMTCPLDFSEVCAMICQPVMVRGLLYSYSYAFNGKPYGALGWASWAKDGDGRRDKALKSVGMPDNALVLTAQRDLKDLADLTEDEFVERLNKMVRELATR